MERKRIAVMDILLCLASLAFLLGQIFLFHACDAHEDGSWMTCHWADISVRASAAMLFVIAAGRLFFKSPELKRGAALAMIPVAGIAAVIPGGLIDLCMMNTMRCHAVMRPAVLVFSVLIIVLAAADVILKRRKTA